MPKEVRRGYVESDNTQFEGEQLQKLSKAAGELEYLLGHGYPMKTASTFIGNHYAFSERQRLALARSVCSEYEQIVRQGKRIFRLEDVAEVNIDGFNSIITLEVAYAGSPVLKCRDQAVRDLAGLRGTYRIIDKTETAVNAIFLWLDKNKIMKANFYLDAPVSNSGRLASLIWEISRKYDVDVEVKVINDVDRVLEGLENVVTSDGIILSRCTSWINMNQEILSGLNQEIWWVDLKGYEYGFFR